MNTDRWHRLRAVFEEVDGLEPGEARARARVLADGDAELLAEVEAMLGSEDSARSFLDPWVSALDGSRRIDGFTIRRIIGSGGMGTVYEAEQDEPRRTVALKTLRDGLRSEEARARFRVESKLLARLEHPAIARVYSVGTRADASGDDVPYFVMELIDGARTVKAWVQEERPPLTRVLELFCEICAAVQHGHDRGVLHRDLKPGNLLVDADGLPKVIDFGVARALDAEVTSPRTSAGELVGTLAYMSPEQVVGSSDEIDVRTDVYALGVVFYELLTGRKPIALDGSSLGEAIAQIREVAPRRLSEHDASLAGDLEWICLRALEKERERRYPSPAAFADDIARHLDHRPVAAGPPSALYRLSKFVRRNRLAVAMGTAIVLVLAVGFGVSVRQFLRAESEVEVRVRVSQFLADMLTRAQPEVALEAEVTVRELLDWAAGELDDRFASDPFVEAELRHTIGHSYLSLGRYDEANHHLIRSAALIEQTKGRDSPGHLGAVSVLARALAQQGDHDAAYGIYQHVVPLVREAFGDDDPRTTAVRINHAITLFDMGRRDESFVIARDVVARRRSQHGERDVRTLTTMLTLATQLSQAGQYAEAEELFDEIARGRSALPRESTVLLNFTNEYGGFLMLQQRPQEAKAVFESGYQEIGALYGEEHVYALTLQSNLANALIQSGDVAGGMAHYDFVFDPSDRLPTDRLRASTHRVIYAEGLRRTGRLDESRLQMKLWREAASNVFEPGHPAFQQANVIEARIDGIESEFPKDG